MKRGINEVLLVDSNMGNIYEGMSSNFFAIVNPSLSESGKSEIWTAPLNLVLKGTVMSMVLSGCEELNIPIRIKLPNIYDASKGLWEAAFITSTSRLLLPITKIHKQINTNEESNLNLGLIKLHSPLDHPYIKALHDYIRKQIHSKSQLLLN